MRIIVLSCLVASAMACSSGGSGDGPPLVFETTDAPETSAGPVGDPIAQCFGEGLSQTTLGSDGYDNNGGLAGDGTMPLNCDFEGDCCWTNAQPPDDWLEFSLIGGSADAEAVEACFDTEAVPDGNFAVVALAGATDEDDAAILRSCWIDCADSEVIVTLRHWQTSGARLQVCQRDVSLENPTLDNCQVITDLSGGPDEAQLPPCVQCEIVIVASGLSNDNAANIVAIDDVVVDYTACDTGSQTPEPEGGTCFSTCDGFDFEDGNECFDSVSGGLKWIKVNAKNDLAIENLGKFGNRDVGVPTDPKLRTTNTFFGVFVPPGQQQAAIATWKGRPEPAQLNLYYYKAAADCELEVCVDDDCTTIAEAEFKQKDDRKWRKTDNPITIPGGADKVEIKCLAKRNTACACGIDLLDCNP